MLRDFIEGRLFLSTMTTFTVVNHDHSYSSSTNECLLQSNCCSARFSSGEVIPPIFTNIYQNNYSGVISSLECLTESEIVGLRYAGESLLHAACTVANLQILQTLLQKGAKVSASNSFGNTALHTATAEQWTEGVKVLLEYGASPDLMTEELTTVREIRRTTPLHIAIRCGNHTIVTLMLKYEPNLCIRDSENNTIVHLANSLTLLKLLLSREKCVQFLQDRNRRGKTPLHCVLHQIDANEENEVLECVKLLIKFGSDVNALDNKGKTPIYIACKNNLPDIVELLLHIGVNVTNLTEKGESLLHAACEAGCSRSLKLIIDTEKLSGKVLSEDKSGASPFHKAISGCSIECCELLLNNGDHLSQKDSKGITRCQLILNNIPNAVQLLGNVFDKKIQISSDKAFDPSLKVCLDFQLLLYKNKYNIQRSIVNELNSSNMLELLKHPLVESLLYIKWKRIKPFFCSYVILYAFFVLNHTTFIMLLLNNYNEEYNNYRIVYYVLIAFYTLTLPIIIVIAILTMLSGAKEYFTHWETYVNLLVIITAIILPFMPVLNFCETSVRNMCALSVFYGWTELMVLISRFPFFGAYVLMLTRISKSIMKFLFSTTFLLIGFACAFRILFNDVDLFYTLPLTIVKTTMMTIGEIEYGDIFRQSNLTVAFTNVPNHDTFHHYINDCLKLTFLIGFLFLVPILMINLLIGIAVNDISELRRQGQIKRLSKQAYFLVSYEKLVTMLPSPLKGLLAKRNYIPEEISCYPNRKTSKQIIPEETLKSALSAGLNQASKWDEHHAKCLAQPPDQKPEAKAHLAHSSNCNLEHLLQQHKHHKWCVKQYLNKLLLMSWTSGNANSLQKVQKIKKTLKIQETLIEEIVETLKH